MTPSDCASDGKVSMPVRYCAPTRSSQRVRWKALSSAAFAAFVTLADGTVMDRQLTIFPTLFVFFACAASCRMASEVTSLDMFFYVWLPRPGRLVALPAVELIDCSACRCKFYRVFLGCQSRAGRRAALPAAYLRCRHTVRRGLGIRLNSRSTGTENSNEPCRRIATRST